MISNSGQPHNQIRDLTGWEDDELSLLDICKFISHGKTIIIVTTGISILVAMAYLWQASPVYEGKSIIKVGMIGGIGPVEDPTVLKQRLKNEYQVAEKVNFDGMYVTILMHAYSKEKLKIQLEEITKKLLQEHNAIYNSILSIQEKKYKSLEKQINDTRSLIVELEKQIDILRETEPVQAAILSLEQSRLIQTLPGLEEKLTSIDLDVSEARSAPTKIIDGFIVSDEPGKRNAVIVMTSSLVVGIVIGLFIAFLNSFLHRIKSEFI